MFTPTLENFLFLQFVVFLGGFTTAITGFGGGIVQAPILSQKFSPTFFTPFLSILYLINNLLLFKPKKDIDWKLLRFLLIGNLVGLSLGTWLLTNFADTPYLVNFFGNVVPIKIKTLVGIFILVWESKVLYELLSGKDLEKGVVKINSQLQNLTNGLAGLVSGFMSGSISMGGPALVIYLKKTQDISDPEKFKNLLFNFWVFNGISQIIILLIFQFGFKSKQFYNQDSILAVILSIFVLVISTKLGQYLAPKIPQKTYKICVSILLMLAGFVAIVGLDFFKI